MLKICTEKYILVKTQFAGTHNWPTCDDQFSVDFLKYRHRHIFYIEAILSVSHKERQLEFFCVKEEIDNFIQNNFFIQNRIVHLKDSSCETLAEQIVYSLLDLYDCKYIKVQVLEDNECGGIAAYSEDE